MISLFVLSPSILAQNEPSRVGSILKLVDDPGKYFEVIDEATNDTIELTTQAPFEVIGTDEWAYRIELNDPKTGNTKTYKIGKTTLEDFIKRGSFEHPEFEIPAADLYTYDPKTGEKGKVAQVKGERARVLYDNPNDTWSVVIRVGNSEPYRYYLMGRESLNKHLTLELVKKIQEQKPVTPPSAEDPEQCQPQDQKKKPLEEAIQKNESKPAASRIPIPKRDQNWTYEAASDFIARQDFSPAPTLISREDWGARTPKGMSPMNGVNGIVIHHTASPITQSAKSIQDFHIDRNGWSDMGYHYVIGKNSDGEWVVFEGREEKFQGAHAGRSSRNGNLNPHQIGIVIVGNYAQRDINNLSGYSATAQEFERQPSPQAVDQLGRLITDIQRRHPTATKVYSHGLGDSGFAINPGHTLCPGPGCRHIITGMRSRFHRESNK